MEMFSSIKAALRARFQARAMHKQMDQARTKELARNGPVTICSGAKASAAVKRIEKAIKKVFDKPQPAKGDDRDFKLLIDRMSSSSNKHGVWRKQKPVAIQM